jgi:hypothetical protein
VFVRLSCRTGAVDDGTVSRCCAEATVVAKCQCCAAVGDCPVVVVVDLDTDTDDVACRIETDACRAVARHVERHFGVTDRDGDIDLVDNNIATHDHHAANDVGADDDNDVDDDERFCDVDRDRATAVVDASRLESRSVVSLPMLCRMIDASVVDRGSNEMTNTVSVVSASPPPHVKAALARAGSIDVDRSLLFVPCSISEIVVISGIDDSEHDDDDDDEDEDEDEDDSVADDDDVDAAAAVDEPSDDKSASVANRFPNALYFYVVTAAMRG